MLAFYFLIWWHFLVMIMVIMIISGIVCFLFPRFPSFIIILTSGFIGYLYSLIINGEALAFIIITINIVVSIIPVLLVKYVLFLQRKAMEMKNSGTSFSDK